MGTVAELYDSYNWQQLRAEVGRLARAVAMQMHQAGRDREELSWVARGVLRRVDIDYARHFARPDAPIAGLTLPVALDVDTVRRVLAAYDRAMEEAAANRAAQAQP